MSAKSMLALCKALFILGLLAVCALWAFRYYISGIVLLVLLYLFDFTTRRCPHCGKHFSIQYGKLEHCPFCGGSLR